MTRVLKAGRKGPKSGQVKSVVVLLHGYGADGADLLGLADPLGDHLPDTLFIAPDAPETCAASPFGRQWFPIPRFDGSTEAQASAGLEAAAQDLNAFLDGIMEETGLPASAMAVIGFSQGTMMTLQVTPRRAAPVAAVVGFSGRLLRPELLAADVVSRPPVLLCHGDADEVVPFASMAEAGQALIDAGFEVYAHVEKGTGHGIAPDGLSAALGFLKAHLPK
ncbi:dienelactone hydrolase family protein [Thioclava litoralis]|uniref:Dienelactone hydrolase family protein n=1 Tax=Thioclava litoralis TaxID=3076557 RepID=A0ABZ1DYQ8_9RHOB|nr:dienelactone hydrolase family protein [Thioclava sp. FTW29]